MKKTPQKAPQPAAKQAAKPKPATGQAAKKAAAKPKPAMSRPAAKQAAKPKPATGQAAKKAAAAASAAGPALSGKAVFARLQRHSLDKPGAVEEYPWGDVAWKVRGKLFAVTGQGAAGVTVKASLEDQAVLVQHPAISIAPYVGRFGWVSIEIGDEETLALACKLIDESYAEVAGPRGSQRQAASPAPPRRSRPSRPSAP
jgi:predicted DNA-binding protein (MmcQ/YjbR family)